MIITIVGEHKPQGKPFPKMMKCKDSELQVFFTEPQVGIVAVGDADWDKSEYEGDWDMSSFEDVGDTVGVTGKPFPKLMMHTDGTITRFEEPEFGIHVYSPDEDTTTWEHILGISMYGYTDYNGQFAIQNA